MPRSLSTPFAGFSRPTYTQVPDELFDHLMPQLSDAELRVLLYIIRRTFGFKREADAISLSQMVSGITTKDGRTLDSGTGLSKSTVARGLAGLRAKGVILAERTCSQTRGNEPTTYRLHLTQDSTQKTDQSAPVSQQRDTPRVSKARQAVSQQQDRQERGDNKTDFDYSKDHFFVDTPDRDRIAPGPNLTRTGSHRGLAAMTFDLKARLAPGDEGDDHPAIAATINRLAEELGDRADIKVTIRRAQNLFDASDIGRAAFLDLLYRAKGETLDRHRHPGKAPVPRNLMAYFFAVVEDKLPVKHD